jgi:hypothetical protein
VVQVPKGVVDLIEGEADVTGEPPNNPFPLLRCDHSIYVLPGVPHLLVHQFALLRAVLANGAACTSTRAAFHAAHAQPALHANNMTSCLSGEIWIYIV